MSGARPQMVSRSAQCEIACLQWNEAPDKHELKFAFMAVADDFPPVKQGRFQAGFSLDQKKLLPIRGGLSKEMRRGCRECGRFLIGGTRGPHVPVTTAQTGNPISGLPLLCIQLGEAFRPGQTAIQRAKHERGRSVPQKVCDGTGKHRDNRQNSQYHVEVTAVNPPPELAPSVPFEGDLKRIAGRREALTPVIILKDPAQSPVIKLV